MRQRLAFLAALLVLAGCEASHSPAPQAVLPPLTSPAPAPALGAAAGSQVAENSGIDACGGSAESVVLSDRGIGGTGISTTLADRGIGGTGIQPGDGIGGTGISPGGIGGTGISPGGIGGTGLTTRSLTHGHAAAPAVGIVGVVGGLPNLCVDGLRIALDGPAHITVDGEERKTETLRVGQVASVEASGAADDLHAVRIEIRHEVSGPITAVAPAGDSVEVMGQHVLLSARTRLAGELRVGGWVAVSGLRDPEGTIRASRIDGRAPGDVVLAGIPRLVDGVWQIRGLPLALPAGVSPSGERVVVGGAYAGGTLRVAEFAEDPLVRADGSLRRLVVEGYPTVADNKVKIGAGILADVGPKFGQTPPADRPIILELDSSPAALVAVSWHEAGSGGAGHSVAPVTPPAPSSLLQAPAPAIAVAAPTAAATTTVATTTTTATTVAAATTTTTTTAASATATSSGVATDTSSQTATTPGGGGGGVTVVTVTTSGGTTVATPVATTGSAASPAPSPSPPAAPVSFRAPAVSIGEGSRSLPSAPPAPGAASEGDTTGATVAAGAKTAVGKGGATTGSGTAGSGATGGHSVASSSNGSVSSATSGGVAGPTGGGAGGDGTGGPGSSVSSSTTGSTTTSGSVSNGSVSNGSVTSGSVTGGSVTGGSVTGGSVTSGGTTGTRGRGPIAKGLTGYSGVGSRSPGTPAPATPGGAPAAPTGGPAAPSTGVHK